MEESKLSVIAQQLKKLANELIDLEGSNSEFISNELKNVSEELLSLEVELKGAVESDKVYPIVAQLIGSRPKDR